MRVGCRRGGDDLDFAQLLHPREPRQVLVGAVDAPRRGSHQFRHALAVRMLQGGASLREIGEVLRHQSPQTTSIYARVDIGALRSLAMPWPGGVR